MVISTEDRSDFLNKLFTDKDFEFLSNYEVEMKSLERNLQRQKIKKEEINEAIETLKSHNNTSANFSKDEYEKFLLKLQEALEYTEENIRHLSKYQADLVYLDKEIVDFMIRFERENNLDILKADMSQIQLKINTASQKFPEVQNVVFLNDVKIDNIINRANAENDDSEKVVITKEEIKAPEEVKARVNVTTIDDLEDNKVLLISEKDKIVFLPYTKEEIVKYYDKYPKDYKNYKDVIKKEFILPLSCFSMSPAIARFREGYALQRDSEARSIFEALKFGLELMFKSELYPAVIPACKTEDTLNKYIECLDNNSLDKFTEFEIKFEVTPLKTHKKDKYEF